MRHFNFLLKAFSSSFLWPLLAVSVTFSCQDEDLTAQYIRIKMIGAFEEPETLANDEGTWVEPISQTYELQNVVLFSTSEAGEQMHELYADEEPASFRITNQTQRIFRKEIESELADLQFSRFVLVFANSITGVSTYKVDHELSLESVEACQASDVVTSALANIGDSCILEYDQAFTFSKGLSYNFIVQINWKKNCIAPRGWRYNDGQHGTTLLYHQHRRIIVYLTLPLSKGSGILMFQVDCFK